MSAAIRQVDHPGALTLRRLHAGEAVGADVQAHASTCAECQARLKTFTEEQQRFEEGIPFERFAAGVERAARTPREVQRPRAPWLQVVLSLAALLLFAVGFGQFVGIDEGGRNRLKSGGDIEVVIAGAGPQRSASPTSPEPLARGERVRIGYSAGTWHYLAVLSIDEAGQVTPLYPERGTSLPIAPEGPKAWLPDSLEFTGSGLERVVVVMTQDPTDMQVLAKEAKRRYDEAQGELGKMNDLAVPGDQFHRTFLKP
jgi:Domain of unknown function (DUF4384)